MFLGVPFSTRIRAACLTAISTLVLLLTIRRFAIFDNILVTTVTTCNSFTNHPLAYQSSMCHYPIFYGNLSEISQDVGCGRVPGEDVPALVRYISRLL